MNINELEQVIANPLNEESIIPNDSIGHAARAAAMSLMKDWKIVLKEGCKRDLPADFDGVISILRNIQQQAREELPPQNGGLAGKSVLFWLNQLQTLNIFVYESTENPEFFGYTNCKTDNYPSRQDAVIAAMKDNTEHFLLDEFGEPERKIYLSPFTEDDPIDEVATFFIRALKRREFRKNITPETFVPWSWQDEHGNSIAQLAAASNQLPSWFDLWELPIAEDGWTVAHEAARAGTLPDNFDRWTIQCEEGWPVAFTAAKHKNLPLDFDQWDITDFENGLTVAHIAALNGSLPTSFRLWSLTDEKGESVIDLARRKNIKSVISIYEDYARFDVDEPF